MNVDSFMPNDNPDLKPIVDRIPSGWGKWIDVGPGWYPIVIKLNEDIAKIYPNYEVHQVKEKFGGLRYYCSVDGDYKVRLIIAEACLKADKTCEVCGEPAVLKIRNYWYKTICDSCDKDNEYIIVEDIED